MIVQSPRPTTRPGRSHERVAPAWAALGGITSLLYGVTSGDLVLRNLIVLDPADPLAFAPPLITGFSPVLSLRLGDSLSRHVAA